MLYIWDNTPDCGQVQGRTPAQYLERRVLPRHGAQVAGQYPPLPPACASRYCLPPPRSFAPPSCAMPTMKVRAAGKLPKGVSEEDAALLRKYGHKFVTVAEAFPNLF